VCPETKDGTQEEEKDLYNVPAVCLLAGERKQELSFLFSEEKRKKEE